MDDHRSGSNNSTFAYRHTGANSHISSQPNFVLNTNRLKHHVRTMLRVGIVIDSAERGIVSNQAVITDVDAALILKLTATIDEHAFTDVGVLAAIGIERREDAERFRHLDTP